MHLDQLFNHIEIEPQFADLCLRDLGEETQALREMREGARSTGACNPGVLIGKLNGLEAGTPLVSFEGNASSEPIKAKSIISFSTQDIGCDIVLAFERGDLSMPVVLGRILKSCAPFKGTLPAEPTVADPERAIFTAAKQIILRCGAASITLTAAGKVLIRGAYLETHASGLNRIKGGSVQIN